MANNKEIKEFLSLEPLRKEFEREFQKAKASKETQFNPLQHQYTTRRNITLLFLGGLFVLIMGGYVYAYIYNMAILDVVKVQIVEHKEMLLKVEDVLYPISSLLGASLGFVIGYYFKGEK
jgi:drug/metabolite transporter (DMT)-like permease